MNSFPANFTEDVLHPFDLFEEICFENRESGIGIWDAQIDDSLLDSLLDEENVAFEGIIHTAAACAGILDANKDQGSWTLLEGVNVVCNPTPTPMLTPNPTGSSSHNRVTARTSRDSEGGTSSSAHLVTELMTPDPDQSIVALHEGDNISEICPERISLVRSRREKDLKGLVNDFTNSKMAPFRTDAEAKEMWKYFGNGIKTLPPRPGRKLDGNDCKLCKNHPDPKNAYINCFKGRALTKHYRRHLANLQIQ